MVAPAVFQRGMRRALLVPPDSLLILPSPPTRTDSDSTIIDQPLSRALEKQVDAVKEGHPGICKVLRVASFLAQGKAVVRGARKLSFKKPRRKTSSLPRCYVFIASPTSRVLHMGRGHIGAARTSTAAALPPAPRRARPAALPRYQSR